MTALIRQARSARKTYGWSSLTGDFSGGFIASLIALPYGLAMARLMGLPPILGVFTSIITAPFLIVLGRNPVMIGGVSSVTVPFIAVAIRQQGLEGAAKVSMVAAVLMLVISTLRWGRFISKVPHTVMAGFSCGIGGMMVISQLAAVMGVSGPANGSSAVGQIANAASRLQQTNLASFLIAATVLIFASASVRLSPRLPAPLVGILAAGTLAALAGWSTAQVGLLPSSIPPFAGFSWRPADIYTVLPSGAGLAFVSSVNLLITSRVVEHFRGRHVAIKAADADRELGAYAIANLAAGMFAAPMSVGIPARSLANVQCGATTRLSNLFHAGFLVLFIYEAQPWIQHIPLAALAAITLWMGIRLMEWSTWRRLHLMRRTDALAFLTTAGAAVFANAVFAVALGCSFYGIRWVVCRYWERRITAPLSGQPVFVKPDLIETQVKSAGSG